MKYKELILALMVFSASPVASAADLAIGVTTDNIMYFSGSDSMSKVLTIGLARMCGPRSYITLTDGKAVPVAKGWKCDSALGTTYANLPGVTGPWVVLKNESDSLQGINPLRTGSTVQQLDISNCTVTGATGTCSNALVNKPVYLGFSDVSQQIFAARNALSTQVAGKTYIADIPTGAGVGYGIVVSAALYKLLQIDQAVGTGIPSLSKSQYASLITQTQELWNILLPNGTPHAAQPLTITRRSSSSNLNAVTDIYFLNNPCHTSTIGGALNPSPATAAGASYGVLPNQFILKQMPSTDAMLAEVSSPTSYAIGVIPLTQPQPVNSWKFVAIDGIFPGSSNSPEFQRTNMLNGSYDFFYESYIHRNTSVSISPAVINNINDFSNAIVYFLAGGSNLDTSNGIFGDPLAPAADFGVETSHYSRTQVECATPIWYW